MHLNELLAQLGGEGGRDGRRESQQVVATEAGTTQLGLREWAVGDGVAQRCHPAVRPSGVSPMCSSSQSFLAQIQQAGE